jgi:hypothetical protein
MDEMFDSSIRSAGDLAGVFEFDGDASYFYLYRVNADEGKKVVDAIKVGVGDPLHSEAEVEILWSSDESLVCLQIAGKLVAIFDCIEGKKYGGIFSPASELKLPPSVADRLRGR